MKRFVVGVLVGALLFAAPAWAQNHIRLIINGQEIATDVPPQIVGGRVLVPIRVVSENLGAAVTWDSVSRSVHVDSGIASAAVSCTLIELSDQLTQRMQEMWQLLDVSTEAGIALSRTSEQRDAFRQLKSTGQEFLTIALEVQSGIRQLKTDHCP